MENNYLNIRYIYFIDRFPGRPKLKISEHPDGYSAEIGYMGHYMRFRWSTAHHTLDFNLLNHKGSVKMDNFFNQGKF